MPRATVSVLKFVGTVSLGLLTGVSYTHTTLTLPTLTTLPSATTASQTLTHLLNTSRVQSEALLLLSISSYTLAFALSPPRGGRHPYLLWTSLIAGIGWGAGRYLASKHDLERPSGSLGGFLSSPSSSSSTPASKLRRVDREDDDYIDATHSTAQLTPSTGSDVDINEAHANSTDAFERGSSVNGEEVRRAVEGFRSVEAIKACIYGLGFLMGVVGIWGDGSSMRRPS